MSTNISQAHCKSHMTVQLTSSEEAFQGLLQFLIIESSRIFTNKYKLLDSVKAK